MSFYDVTPDFVRLRVYVQPAAKQNKCEGIFDGCLKIRLATPPVDGKANKALIQFLGKALHVRPSCIILIKGQKNRRKILCIKVTQNGNNGLVKKLNELMT